MLQTLQQQQQQQQHRESEEKNNTTSIYKKAFRPTTPNTKFAPTKQMDRSHLLRYFQWNPFDQIFTIVPTSSTKASESNPTKNVGDLDGCGCEVGDFSTKGELLKKGLFFGRYLFAKSFRDLGVSGCLLLINGKWASNSRPTLRIWWFSLRICWCCLTQTRCFGTPTSNFPQLMRLHASKPFMLQILLAFDIVSPQK